MARGTQPYFATKPQYNSADVRAENSETGVPDEMSFKAPVISEIDGGR